MIETEQSVTIGTKLEGVWDYVKDINNWASLMPGLQECNILDDDNSRWVLKVGVGGLVRTVTVQVHVDEWDGPARAVFTYKLEGDPVEGGGTYAATRNGANDTNVALTVRVVGSGSMAPMWEAMGKPLLPKFVKAFAEQLKEKIEAAAGEVPAVAAAPLRTASLWMRILQFLGTIFGKKNKPAI